MGRLHKLMLRSCLRGIVIGWTVLAVILFFDVMQLRESIFSSEDSALGIFLLMVGFAITFANASMGYSIMSLSKKKNKG